MLKEQIEIFPSRILGEETTKKLTKKISSIEGVLQAIPHVLRYVDGGTVTTRIIVTLDGTIPVDKVFKKIDEVCKQILPFGYTMRRGVFIKPRPTVSDYLRGHVSTQEEPDEKW
ncbi:MAG: methyl-coenzyme M reductase operon protein D [Candidatus Nezhaarchaeota archaeon]|nr:methyl-coenzyme M reductase operon protein D [Candidatus Nezhaarchaeota archaeon]MCX8141668.1 methyl-coenzyme M reductase operon protein D [Candidatus Nezhaarchaeota archaeon]MDW8049935.1 methyl-coenzyme M reductase operon protein D [Nitrososphaerota archaeon]